MIFLEFEKPLASLYEQLEKLKEIGEAGDIERFPKNGRRYIVT
jgi:acetyl-CoA carboxylase carboxyl transferase subunit alpha